MFIISGSAMRSGSSWYLNLTNDILVTAGNYDVRQLRTEANAEAVIQNDFVDMGKPKYQKLLSLLMLSWRYGRFVVKTHSNPSRGMHILASLGLIKATYIFRDPRDRLLSLMDMGKRARAAGDEKSPFWLLHNFEGSLKHIMRAKGDKEAWEGLPNVLVVRYENLVNETYAEAKRLAQYLGVNLSEEDLQKIIGKYSAQTLSQDAKFTNYQKGQIGRYKDVLTAEEIQIIHDKMGDNLIAMGYDLN